MRVTWRLKSKHLGGGWWKNIQAYVEMFSFWMVVDTGLFEASIESSAAGVTTTFESSVEMLALGAAVGTVTFEALIESSALGAAGVTVRSIG